MLELGEKRELALKRHERLVVPLHVVEKLQREICTQIGVVNEEDAADASGAELADVAIARTEVGEGVGGDISTCCIGQVEPRSEVGELQIDHCKL